MKTLTTQAHFIEAKTGKMVYRDLILNIPRVGEECRFKDGEYWRVTCVIHVYDEDDHPYHRVNIGLEQSK